MLCQTKGSLAPPHRAELQGRSKIRNKGIPFRSGSFQVQFKLQLVCASGRTLGFEAPQSLESPGTFLEPTLSHPITFAAHKYVHGFEKADYYSSVEEDRPYFVTDQFVRFIIDFNVPVPRGNDRQSFLKRRKED